MSKSSLAVRRSPLIPKQPLREFNFALVQERLDGVLINVDRDMQRKVKEASRSGKRELEHQLVTLNLMVRFAKNSYNAVGYLVAQIPEDSGRRPNYVLVIPSVNRQLLDLLFSLVYMLDDLSERIMKYGRSGWRELKESNDRYLTRFSGDPAWKAHFANQKLVFGSLIERFKITAAEQKNPALIPYWWTPSSIKDEQTASRPFLRFLYKWFYKDTSEQAHLSSSGLFLVAPMLLAEIIGGEDENIVDKYARRMYLYMHFSRTAFVTLAIMTEINCYFKLGNNEQISYVWKIFEEHSPEAKDIFEQRYKALLASV